VHQLNKHNWHICDTAKAIGIDRANLTLKRKNTALQTIIENFLQDFFTLFKIFRTQGML